MTNPLPVRQVSFRFDSHGLGDVVHAIHCVQLLIQQGYKVRVNVEPNKRWLWEFSGVEIVDDESYSTHRYAYPAGFFDLNRPDCDASKITSFFDIPYFPEIGTKAEIWERLKNVNLAVEAIEAVTEEVWNEASKFLDGLPHPIICLHSKGTNWQNEKSIPDSVAFEALVGLVERTGGSVVVLDYDARVPTIAGHPRIKNVKPDWGHISIDRLVALLSSCDLMIGIDSGPFHVATMIGIPTLGVFRHIPCVRCCIPQAEATYLVPHRDREQWEKRRDEWKFVEYPGHEVTAEDIVDAAWSLLSPPATTEQAEVAGRYTYRRVGYDERPITLEPSGKVTEGMGACERRWTANTVKDVFTLTLLGDGNRGTCHLSASPDGVYRGSWLSHERMPIELVPLLEPRPTEVDIHNGQLQEWTPDEAAARFSRYRREWNLSVRTRGNGALWLIDPDIERSDMDAETADHEDWMGGYLNLEPGSVFLDLASFVGANAVHAAHRGVNVIAVEPIERIRTLLRRNLELNGLALTVRVWACAFSEQEGRAVMAYCGMNSHLNSLGDESVDVTTLDLACRELDRIDLIKLDVEGAECDVIQGGMETLKRLKPRLIIEVHGHMPGCEDNPRRLAEQLDQLGYSTRRIWTNTDLYFYIEAIHPGKVSP
jgi:FkbM family methyltransferase